MPDGKDEKDNVEHHRFGAKRDYAFAPKQHFELGEAIGQMDFETAAKLSGARFVVLKKGLARLERALGQFMLDMHTSEPHNYTEVAPPLLSVTKRCLAPRSYRSFEKINFDIRRIAQEERRDVLQGAHCLIRDFLNRRRGRSEGLIVLEANLQSPFWLIPTAEVPLTNLVRESIVDEAQLPMRLTACTPCFRAEAGAAGKDTRGMIRQHQFTKVELVSITTPEQVEGRA